MCLNLMLIFNEGYLYCFSYFLTCLMGIYVIKGVNKHCLYETTQRILHEQCSHSELFMTM